MREAKELELKAQKALKFLGRKNSAVSIFFVSDKFMRELVRQFLGKNSSTNVLSFPSPKFPQVGKAEYLGEIYLNLSYITRHREDKKFMFVHGLLHLLGYNHKAKGDRIEMEHLEKRLLAWLERQF